MFYVLTPFLLLLLIVLQSIISGMFFHSFLTLEFALIIVIYAGFHFDLLRGMFLSFVAGLMIDSISGFILGMSSFVYVLIFLGSFFISEFLDTGKTYIVTFFVFVCVFLKETLVLLLYSMALKTDLFSNGWVTVVAQSLIAGCFTPVIFYGMRRLEEVVYETHP